MKANPRPLPKTSSWENAPLSPWSRFGDDEWLLDIRTPGRRADQNRFDWSGPIQHGARIGARDHEHLRRSARHFLWSMRLNPPPGRKRSSLTSLQTKAMILRTIIGWMAHEGLRRFAEIDVSAVERLCVWLRNRSARLGSEGQIRPGTVMSYLLAIKDMYRQRTKLDDAPLVDPLPLETTYEAAGHSRATTGAIPFIPERLAIAILSEALRWIEAHGETIATAETIRLEARSRGLRQGKRHASYHVRRALKLASLVGPSGERLDGAYAVRHAAVHLVEACYIVIAGFVGMRVSEILSMRVGAIEHRPIGTTGLDQAYVVARLYKTVDDPDGRVERWLAPAPVVRAVDLLEQLSAPMRATSGREELFLVKNTQYGEIVPVTCMHIAWRINDFARQVGIPDHDGKPWLFSTHQFRKTFARFIARRDRTQLLGLADHFKHASVAMTARGYVGSDFDLHELVDHEARSETAAALDLLLAATQLGGKMGERIVAGNARFRGRAGEQVRRDYIVFILDETDLRIHACDYGWCVFQQETSRCGGVFAPDEVGRAPAVCLTCANMVIEAKHGAYWRDRRARNAALLPSANRMTEAVLNQAIEQCERVLVQIGDCDGQG
jgi:integrase